MAEIKIQKRIPFWIWIIALILVTAILYFIFSGSKKNNDNAIVTNSDTTQTGLLDQHENNDTVAAYINFITADTSAMALDHTYSSDALNKLVSATQAMANALNYDIRADVDSGRIYADNITKDPMAVTHADDISRAAIVISNSLENMQRINYPTLKNNADEVKNAAMAIDPDVLTLDQKDKVRSFFEKTAFLLQKMN